MSEGAVEFDPYWSEALQVVRDRYRSGERLIAPNEFLQYVDGFFPIHIRRSMIPDERIDWYLLHKGMLDWIDPAIGQEALTCYTHFANEVFVLFGRSPYAMPESMSRHVDPIREWASASAPQRVAAGHLAIIKTYERPDFLERCLRSVRKETGKIVVVDDGSSAANLHRNVRACDHAGAHLVALGRNCGAACAINVGIALALSDLEIEWISVFDDDVEIARGALARLQRIADAHQADSRNNLYSGYLSPRHAVACREIVAGENVAICRSCSGQHLFAHRVYWQRVVPVPTPYSGAPKETGGNVPGQGSEVDWWCTNWAPESALKRGGIVCVLPGLVTTFGSDKSTWNGIGL